MRHNVGDMEDRFSHSHPNMTTLYHSDDFVVVHLRGTPVADAAAEGEAAPVDRGPPRMERDGFEIVDKRAGRHVYLEGGWADLFERQIQAWRQITPTQEEVEDALEHYASLAGNPVVLH